MLQEKIMKILGKSADGREEIISLLIETAISFSISYCNLTMYKEELDPTIIRMVVEDFNRLGSEGVEISGFNGVSEKYAEDYSPQVYKQLNRYRRIKFL